MTLKTTGTLVLMLYATACAAPESAEDRPVTGNPDSTLATPAQPPAERDAWLRDALAAARLDRAALRAELGAPSRRTAHAQPNRHDPSVTDSLVDLEYADARFVYYVVTAGPSDLLDFAEVRDDRHLALTPPGIGTPADSLRAWWGPPVASTDSTLEYDCTTCEVPHPATFVVADGRVRAIRFDLYVD
jgi:hypothetical protein